jgi:trigger factor
MEQIYMTYNINKIDEINTVVDANLSKELINTKLNKLLNEASKTIEIQGFRKGKVPVAIIKKRYGTKMLQDAEGEVLRDLFTIILKELKISNEDLVGEPDVTKYDKKEDDSVDVEIKISSNPIVPLGDYKSLLPEINLPIVTEDEVDENINEIAKYNAPLVKIQNEREAKEGDYTIIDFEGFKDDIPFSGGKAENYPLQLGSESFIPGFEDQVIGMKYNEERDIKITFPKEYQAEELAGAEVLFKVTLKEIQEKEAVKIDDEFAKKILKSDDVTLEILREKIKQEITAEKINKYYQDELKSKYMEALVESIDFAIPTSIVNQEENQILNNLIRDMDEDKIKELQENQEKVEKMRAEINPDAINSIKATFIIDALAKAENIDVTDQDVDQTIYYEATQSGQDGEEILKQYKEQGYLPAIKMSMLEQKVITKLLNEKAGI